MAWIDELGLSSRLKTEIDQIQVDSEEEIEKRILIEFEQRELLVVKSDQRNRLSNTTKRIYL